MTIPNELRSRLIALVIAVAAAIVLFLLPETPYLLDMARYEALILLVLGGGGALITGRPMYRALLGAIILIVALAYQLSVTYVIATQPQACSTAYQEMFLAFMFLPLFVEQLPWAPLSVVVIVLVGVFAWFRKAPFPTRLVYTTWFLLTASVVTAAVLRLTMRPDSFHCVNF